MALSPEPTFFRPGPRALVFDAGPRAIHGARLQNSTRQFLKATRDERTVIVDPKALYFGLIINDQSLMPGNNPRLGPMRFSDWLNLNT